MVARTTTQAYEQSSESGRERVLDTPYASQVVNPPVLHDPVCVTPIAATPTLAIQGTSLVLDAIDSVSMVNVARGAVYRHNVRNVITWGAGPGFIETAWRALNVGDPVFYDPSVNMPAGCVLSTAPTNAAGVLNPRFGFIVLLQEESAASYPKGNAQAGLTDACAVIRG